MFVVPFPQRLQPEAIGSWLWPLGMQIMTKYRIQR